MILNWQHDIRGFRFLRNLAVTLHGTNIAPVPKGNSSSNPSVSGAMLVSGRVLNQIIHQKKSDRKGRLKTRFGVAWPWNRTLSSGFQGEDVVLVDGRELNPSSELMTCFLWRFFPSSSRCIAGVLQHQVVAPHTNLIATFNPFWSYSPIRNAVDECQHC